MKHIIITNTPDSEEHIGPFDTLAQAKSYGEKHLKGAYALIPLTTPIGLPEVPRVLVQVFGGVAELVNSTHKVDVEIFDYDNWWAAGRAEQKAMILGPEWRALDPSLPSEPDCARTRM